MAGKLGEKGGGWRRRRGYVVTAVFLLHHGSFYFHCVLRGNPRRFLLASQDIDRRITLRTKQNSTPSPSPGVLQRGLTYISSLSNLMPGRALRYKLKGRLENSTLLPVQARGPDRRSLRMQALMHHLDKVPKASRLTARERSASAEQASASAEQASAGVEQASASAEQTSASAEQASASAEQASDTADREHREDTVRDTPPQAKHAHKDYNIEPEFGNDDDDDDDDDDYADSNDDGDDGSDDSSDDYDDYAKALRARHFQPVASSFKLKRCSEALDGKVFFHASLRRKNAKTIDGVVLTYFVSSNKFFCRGKHGSDSRGSDLDAGHSSDVTPCLFTAMAARVVELASQEDLSQFTPDFCEHESGYVTIVDRSQKLIALLRPMKAKWKCYTCNPGASKLCQHASVAQIRSPIAPQAEPQANSGLVGFEEGKYKLNSSRVTVSQYRPTLRIYSEEGVSQHWRVSKEERHQRMIASGGSPLSAVAIDGTVQSCACGAPPTWLTVGCLHHFFVVAMKFPMCSGCNRVLDIRLPDKETAVPCDELADIFIGPLQRVQDSLMAWAIDLGVVRRFFDDFAQQNIKTIYEHHLAAVTIVPDSLHPLIVKERYVEAVAPSFLPLRLTLMDGTMTPHYASLRLFFCSLTREVHVNYRTFQELLVSATIACEPRQVALDAARCTCPCTVVMDGLFGFGSKMSATRYVDDETTAPLGASPRASRGRVREAPPGAGVLPSSAPARASARASPCFLHAHLFL